MERIEAAGLTVAPVLHAFLEREALPGTGIDPAAFWEGFAAIVRDLAPRNRALPANRDPAFYDMGLCGPLRKDLATQTQYCGMFLTPTLRNVATRKVFFHNGVYTSLKQVLDFYNLRSTQPERIYPRGPDGQVQIYDDLPAKYHANVDRTDAPFDRARGARPALTEQEEDDIIAFLRTLNDGYTRTPKLASAY